MISLGGGSDVVVVEMIFGKLSRFDFTFTHVCLVAILIVLISKGLREPAAPVRQRSSKSKKKKDD